MKKTITVISIICVLIIAGGVLILTGVIDISSLFGKGSPGSQISSESQTAEDETGLTQTNASDVSDSSDQSGAVIWIEYMDTCVLVDKDGKVIGTSSLSPEGVMKLSGIGITKMVRGSRLEVDDQEAYDYGLDLTVKLAAVGIPDKGEVFISSDHSAIVYLKNIKILFGKNSDLLEKLEALRKFYNKVITLEGTLDMQELSRNKMGYTFRTDNGESESSILEEDESEIQSDEDGQAEDDGSADEEDTNDEEQFEEEQYEEDLPEDDEEYEEYIPDDGEYQAEGADG